MSIKAGAIIHDVHGFVVDRIQTGGAGQININEEKIYELGNWDSVGTVRDTPDLSFDLESFDVSTELEALLTFVDPTTVIDGDAFDLNDSTPLDVISPFKPGTNLFTVDHGLIIPYLTLENSTYRFGIRENATQQHTLRGDSFFFVDGAPYYEEFSGDGSTATFNLAQTAIPYNYAGDTLYVVGLCVVFADGTYRRLFFGEDYTNTTTSFTLLDAAGDSPAGSTLKAVYGSAAQANYPSTIHEGIAVKPAAVRGKDIDVYVGDAAATPTFTRWTSVQSFEVTRSVTLDADEEFGNPQYVGQDYDVPEVNGSISVRPRDNQDLWDKVYAVTNVSPGEIAGPLTSVGLPVELRVSDPDTGTRLKTFYIPDARFQIPGVQGRVQTKTEVTFNFTSDGGNLEISKGNRYGT